MNIYALHDHELYHITNPTLKIKYIVIPDFQSWYCYQLQTWTYQIDRRECSLMKCQWDGQTIPNVRRGLWLSMLTIVNGFWLLKRWFPMLDVGPLTKRSPNSLVELLVTPRVMLAIISKSLLTYVIGNWDVACAVQSHSCRILVCFVFLCGIMNTNVWFYLLP